MPYTIRKLTNGYYRVKNTATGVVHSKHTSKTKAEAQVRLLEQKEKK